MSEKKSWSSTVMGWFVVQDEAASAPQAAASHRAAPVASPARSAEGGGAPLKSAPPTAGGKVDFDQVFESSGIPAEERQRVDRTLELLVSLPPDTDDTVKKQIVMASLKAFGVPIEKIIETGAQELQALEGFIRTGASDTEKLTDEAEQRIKQYEQEIVKLRSVMQQRVEEQAAAVRSCNNKKLEVQKVLEFFGQEAVARVVRDSPKLHEPTPA